MKKIALLGFALLACGVLGFTGVFAGSVQVTTTCPNGGPVSNRLVSARWEIVDDAGNKFVNIKNCAGIPFTQNDGGLALSGSFDCPAQTLDDGGTFALTFTDGTISLSNDSKTIAASLNAKSSEGTGTQGAGCPSTYVGSLTRQ